MRPPRWTRSGDCRRTRRELQGYLDGESDPDVAWRVARHLSRCEACFGDADEIRAIKAAVGRLRRAPDAQALARLRVLLARLGDPPVGP